MATKLAVAKAAEAQAKADMVTLAKQAAEDKQKELATALAEAKKVSLCLSLILSLRWMFKGLSFSLYC
tara:strand:- start:130 stop:333 length:204 start_codon:yes stop_codon:yes gene_type:complete